MNKYTRKEINIKAHLHGETFINVKDAEAVMVKLSEEAVKCGADEEKLMGFFNEKDS